MLRNALDKLTSSVKAIVSCLSGLPVPIFGILMISSQLLQCAGPHLGEDQFYEQLYEEDYEVCVREGTEIGEQFNVERDPKEIEIFCEREVIELVDCAREADLYDRWLKDDEHALDVFYSEIMPLCKSPTPTPVTTPTEDFEARLDRVYEKTMRGYIDLYWRQLAALGEKFEDIEEDRDVVGTPQWDMEFIEAIDALDIASKMFIEEEKPRSGYLSVMVPLAQASKHFQSAVEYYHKASQERDLEAFDEFSEEVFLGMADLDKAEMELKELEQKRKSIEDADSR